MSSRRTQKAAEAIREVVSMAILTEIKDPRVKNVTVTFVEVSPDMRQAKIHVSVMGDETRQQLSLRGLQNSAGFLQSKVAKRIDTRYTPRLAFVLDLGVKRSIEISQILQSVLPPDPAVPKSAGAETAEEEWEDDDPTNEDDVDDDSHALGQGPEDGGSDFDGEERSDEDADEPSNDH